MKKLSLALFLLSTLVGIEAGNAAAPATSSTLVRAAKINVIFLGEYPTVRGAVSAVNSKTVFLDLSLLRTQLRTGQSGAVDKLTIRMPKNMTFGAFVAGLQANKIVPSGEKVNILNKNKQQITEKNWSMVKNNSTLLLKKTS